jgi:hypothetical protein
VLFRSSRDRRKPAYDIRRVWIESRRSADCLFRDGKADGRWKAVAGGPSGIGKTASDGSFIIVTANAGEGAVPGTHKVILSSYDAAKPDLSRYSSPSGAAPTEDPTKGTGPIPDEYTNFEQTPQTVKVETSGENFLSIEI